MLSSFLSCCVVVLLSFLSCVVVFELLCFCVVVLLSFLSSFCVSVVVAIAIIIFVVVFVLLLCCCCVVAVDLKPRNTTNRCNLPGNILHRQKVSTYTHPINLTKFIIWRLIIILFEVKRQRNNKIKK